LQQNAADHSRNRPGRIVGVAELKAGTPVAVTYTKATSGMTAQMVHVYRHHMRHMRHMRKREQK